jgi:tetratricopeptide (TPR) repeat protein
MSLSKDNSLNSLSLLSYLRQQTTDSNTNVLIKQFLTSYHPQVQLDILIDLFDNALDQETYLHEAIVAAWSYLQDTHLYRTQYQTLQLFKDAINYSESLEPILQQSTKHLNQVSNAINTILTNWNINLLTDLPQDIRPPHISKHLAASVARLTKITTYHKALDLFHSAIKLRQDTIGKRRLTYLYKQDVDRCYEILSQSDNIHSTLGK